MSVSCAIARQRLARYVAELRAASTVEKATTAIKAGMVGSIVTPSRALAGNTSWGGLRALALQPTEAGVDYLLSVGKHVASGRRVPIHEFREVVNALDAEGLRVMARGFKAGTAPTREAYRAAKSVRGPIGARVAAFVQELGTRLEAEQVASVLEVDRVKYASPTVQTLVDGAFAVLEAADRPWWRLAFDSSVYMQGKLLAIREGLTGAERAARASEHVRNPTPEMLARATDDANYATFKDPNLLSRGASQVKRFLAREADRPVDGTTPYARAAQRTARRGAAAAQYIVDTNVPFTGVPSSVAYKIGAVSPLGLLSPKILGSQAERARVLATAGVGTAMWAAGFALFKQDRITGAMPTSPSERRQWEAEGRQPFSVKIGNTWVGLQSLGPAAIPLFMGAQLAKLRTDEPEAGAGEVAARTAAFAGKVWTEQTYLQGVKRLIDAASSEHAGAALVGAQVPIPAVVGQAAKALDPVVRDTKGLKNRTLSRLPGLSRFADPKVDATGQAVRRTPLERVAAVASPFPVRESKETPLLAEMRRLKVTFQMPSRSLVRGGVRVERTPEDYRALVADVGPGTVRALETLIGSPAYANAPDEVKARAMERLITRQSAAGRTRERARSASTASGARRIP